MTKRHQPLTPEQLETALRLYDEINPQTGRLWTVNDIAIHLHRGREVVRDALRAAGKNVKRGHRNRPEPLIPDDDPRFDWLEEIVQRERAMGRRSVVSGWSTASSLVG